MIPYGKQNINEKDVKTVSDALKDDFLTTGPKIKEFEDKFAQYVGSKYAVAVSSGTAALHLSCLAAELKEGDEIITSPMSFAASANCAFYCNAKPVFVDINEQGLIDEDKIENFITEKTKIIIPVHYSGLPCNLERINEIAKKHNLIIIEDACHALGARYKSSKIGDCTYSDMAVFSFHPVKHITTGEGGMITTNSKELYEKLILLRNHGITKDQNKLINKNNGGWYYEMLDLGYNYRLTDFQCALGINQLGELENFIQKRRKIAKRYDENFNDLKEVEILKEKENQFNVYHLYVIKLQNDKIRKKLYDFLKEQGIFCQVHYIPIYWHPYYKEKGYEKVFCPNAERFYSRVLSIPIFPALKDDEQDYTIQKIKEFFKKRKKKGIIIQARMNSTRLPGKVLLDLAGKPVLWHVVQRCMLSDVDEVIVATSVRKEDDKIENFCRQSGISFFRGSENDVLERYYECSEKFNLDVIVRVTADCPLISPEIIDYMLEKFEDLKCDLLSNAIEKMFPHGLDLEIFTVETLKRAQQNSRDSLEREHVTAYMYNLNEFNVKNLKPHEDLENFYGKEIRITLDTKEDLKLFKIIYDGFYRQGEIIKIDKVIKFLKENPFITKINLESEKENLEKNKEIDSKIINFLRKDENRK